MIDCVISLCIIGWEQPCIQELIRAGEQLAGTGTDLQALIKEQQTREGRKEN